MAKAHKNHPNPWTKKRAAVLKRDSKGRFQEWLGGYDHKDLKKSRNTQHGIQVHIGKEYVKQYGKAAGIGAVVRKRNLDGSYNKGAEWYVKTRYGWRAIKGVGFPGGYYTNGVPPAAAIKATMAGARPGVSAEPYSKDHLKPWVKGKANG